ncbi:MAG: DNA primase, partial [Methanothrix sp.]
MNDISELIIKNLIQNERYCRAVMPFLKLEYFENKDRFVFKLICTFVTKYNTLPNCTALQYEFGNLDKQPENAQEIVEYIDLLFTITDDDKRVDETWLLSTTEEWCKDRAVYLGVIQSIEIINGTDVETP